MSDTGSSGSDRHDGTGTPPDGGSGGTPPPPPPSGGGTPPPPPPPPSDAGSTTGQAVDIGPRLGARLIDAIILWIVTFVITILIIGPTLGDVGAMDAFTGGMGVRAWVATLLATAINVGYFAYLESSRGQTFGKQLLNIRVVGPGGGNPTMEQALKRNLWLAAGLIPIVGGLIELGLVIWIIVTITNGADKRGVHDEWAGGTQVVHT